MAFRLIAKGKNARLCRFLTWGGSDGGTGADHDTFPIGVIAQPSVGNPTLGQVHALSLSGVSASPSVGLPALLETTGLVPSSISAAPSVGSPTLSQLHSLAPSGISAASSVGTPSLSVGGTITIDTATYTRGTAGVAPDLETTVSSTGTTTGNYTLYWATRDAANPALSKTNIENGTGDALDNGSIVAAALADLDGSLDLSTSLTSDAIDLFIRDSSGSPIESDVSSVTGVTYDAVAPAYSSSVVENASPSNLVITLTKATYEAGTLAPADFTLGGTYAGSISTATLTNTTTITLGLSTPVANGDTLTVALTDGAVLVGVDAEAVATWTAQSVTNNVAASPTVPDAFVDADWSVATGSGAGELDVTIASLPSNGGATITDVEYDLDASGSWVSSGGTTSFTISGLTASTSYAVRLRAVNSVGNSAAGNSESATSGAASGVTDDFNRADSNLESDAAWTLQSGSAGTLSVVSNQLELLTGASGGSIYTHSDTPGSANVYAEMTYVGTSSAGTENRMYLGVRNDTSGNGYFILFDVGASSIFLVEFTGGSESIIGFPSPFPATGSVVRIEANGTTIRVLDDGVEIASVTDTAHSAAGVWALRTQQESATDQQTWDDYDHGTL